MTAIAIPGILAARRRGAGGTILGYNVKDTTISTFAAGRMYVSQYTLAGAGTLRELHGWFNSGGGGDVIRVVCYAADGGGGLPGTRLAYTNGITLPAGDSEAQEAGFAVALAAANYWLGFYNVSGTAGTCFGNGTSGTHQGRTGGAPNPPPTPFGTPDTSGTRRHSCWAVIT